MESLKKTKLIKERIKSETPHFFKRLRKYAIIFGAIAGFVLTLPFSWPAWVTSGLTLIVTICTTVAGTSTLTTNNHTLSKL